MKREQKQRSRERRERAEEEEEATSELSGLEESKAHRKDD